MRSDIGFFVNHNLWNEASGILCASKISASIAIMIIAAIYAIVKA